MCTVISFPTPWVFKIKKVELCCCCVCLLLLLFFFMIVRLKRIGGNSEHVRKNKYECIRPTPKAQVLKIRIPVAAAIKPEPVPLDPNDFLCNKTLPFKRQNPNSRLSSFFVSPIDFLFVQLSTWCLFFVQTQVENIAQGPCRGTKTDVALNSRDL